MMCIYNVLNEKVVWVFITKHYVKPRIFKMAQLPLKTIRRENNAKVLEPYFQK